MATSVLGDLLTRGEYSPVGVLVMWSPVVATVVMVVTVVQKVI